MKKIILNAAFIAIALAGSKGASAQSSIKYFKEESNNDISQTILTGNWQVLYGNAGSVSVIDKNKNIVRIAENKNLLDLAIDKDGNLHIIDNMGINAITSAPTLLSGNYNNFSDPDLSQEQVSEITAKDINTTTASR